MLSTVLFIDEAPVGYKVHKQGSKLFFTPTQFSSRSGVSPRFALSLVDGLWLLDGNVDRPLQVQVFQSLERFRAGGLLE